MNLKNHTLIKALKIKCLGVLTAFLCLNLSTIGLAQTSEAKPATAPAAASEASLKQADEKKSDEADQIITNRRFRASTGSLSKWSFNSSWNYNAGSIERPFDATRPNITAASDVALLQNLSGDVGINYRFSQKDRLSLRTGLQMAAPFHSTVDTNDPVVKEEFENNQGELDIQNPSVSFSRIFKVLGVQNVLSAGAGIYTQGALTDRGYQYFASTSLNTLYDFGKTGASAGLLLTYDRNIFNKDTTLNSRGTEVSLLEGQAEQVFGVYPQAEYEINDTFNIRTILRAWVYEDRRSRKFGDFIQRELTQSVGLGISVTRDIFLYPNVQFAPDNLRADKTNIGLSANINLF
jgi:hypothetical protein